MWIVTSVSVGCTCTCRRSVSVMCVKTRVFVGCGGLWDLSGQALSRVVRIRGLVSVAKCNSRSVRCLRSVCGVITSICH